MKAIRSRGCCGMTEVYGLDSDAAKPLANFKDALAKAITMDGEPDLNEIKADGEPKLRRGYPRGFVIATTGPGQTKAAKLLDDSGFEILTKFWNPQTSRYVTLWGKHLAEEP